MYLSRQRRNNRKQMRDEKLLRLEQLLYPDSSDVTPGNSENSLIASLTSSPEKKAVGETTKEQEEGPRSVSSPAATAGKFGSKATPEESSIRKTTTETSPTNSHVYPWTPSKKRSRSWESPSFSTKKIDPKWLDSTTNSSKPSPSPAPLKSTGRAKFRLSLGDSDDDDDDDEIAFFKRQPRFESSAARTDSTTSRPKLGLSMADMSSDDDENNNDFPKRPSKSNHKTTLFPAALKTAAKDAVDSDSDSDDDSITVRFKASLLKRKVQQQQQPSPRGKPLPKATNAQDAAVHEDDPIEEFVPTQKDSIEDDDSSDGNDQDTKPRAKRKEHLSDSSTDEDDDNELHAVAVKLRDRKNKIACNPITLAHQENLQQQEAAVVARASVPAVLTGNGNGDDLWSDSDPEEVEEESSSKKTRGKRKSGSSSGKRKSPVSSSNSARQTTREGAVGSSDEFWEDLRVLRDHGSMLHQLDTKELRGTLHPELEDPKFDPAPLEPLVLEMEGSEKVHQVPAALNRYLAPFQQDGVRFMYNCLLQNMGSILGDDMGCGKTVQVLSLLSALFEKTGTGVDLIRLNQRKEVIRDWAVQREQEEEAALLQGRILDRSKASLPPDLKKSLRLPERWWPVLIVVPPTVYQNWQNELARFTHFSVACYDGNNKEKAVAQICSGMAEIMLAKKSTFEKGNYFKEINAMPVIWKLVVIDEFHTWKNERTDACKNLRAMKSVHRSLVLAMTGTLMSNDHKELWNLVDLVETDYLGSWDEFKNEVSEPIKLGRTKTASRTLIEISEAKARALQEKLKRILIERKKEDVLVLPEKTERAVMCELSPLQKQVYQHVLTLPDFELVRTAGSPCDCGINAAFFQRVHRLKTREQRLAYYREHKDEVLPRRECCYQFPKNPHYVEGGDEPEVHPDAVIWRMMEGHAEGKPCKQCPYCCGFPALSKLYKLGSHLALLQAAQTPGYQEIGSQDHVTFTKSLEFAKVALDSVVDQLPGQSYIRRDGIMDDHFALSGKLKVLDKLLDNFSHENAKVLVFSQSTESLDLIQNYLKSKGHSFLRMDGKTQNSLRQDLADKFNNDPTVFVFLLSTKAMGVGLNLTSASKVVIFDVEWNPANDQQAQDRAYRIGQRSDVEVLRLISQGTIDEVKYLRQLYKLQLKQETLQDGGSDKPKAARLFRGVQGHTERKGELFGYENLFLFKDGSFLTDIWKGLGQKGHRVEPRAKSGLVIHETSKLTDALLGIGADQFEDVLKDESRQIEDMVESMQVGIEEDKKEEPSSREHNDDFRDEEQEQVDQELEDDFDARAINHHDLFRDDRGRAVVGDDGSEEEMLGGASQNFVAIYEGGVTMPDNPQDGSMDYIDVDNDSNPEPPEERVLASHHDNDLLDIHPPARAPHVVGVPTRAVARLPPMRVVEPEWVLNSDSSATSSHHDVEAEAGESAARDGDRVNAAHQDNIELGGGASSPAGNNAEVGSSENAERDGASTMLNVTRKNTRAKAEGKSSRGSPTATAPNINLFGGTSAHLKDKTTAFSTADLVLPNYKKKKSKKKKASN